MAACGVFCLYYDIYIFLHIDQIIKKASKRMYFLIQLKRANVARHELILFYTSCIRSVMTYASPAFFYALPLYLKKDLENVEKRALSIICPGLAYRKALELSNIMSINDYIASLCKKTFLSITHHGWSLIYRKLKSLIITYSNSNRSTCDFWEQRDSGDRGTVGTEGQ